MRYVHFVLVLVFGAWLGTVDCPAARADTRVSGGGTYSPLPGVLSEFQVSEGHVQCKIAHAVLSNGNVIQMFMESTSIDSVTITGTKAIITGQLTSVTRLRFPDGSTVALSESVRYVVKAEDNGTPGAGTDHFSITVTYNPSAPKTAGLNQAALFGASATFQGVLLSGDIVVH